MNRSTIWKERRIDTEIILNALISDLQKGYNPITNNTVGDPDSCNAEITLHTPLIDALFFGLQSAKNRLTRGVYKDAEIVLNYIKHNVYLSGLTIGNTTRKHMIWLLNKVGEHKRMHSKKKEWTNNNYKSF
jgi:hypothetical protein